jgi:hypothetical protein
MIHWSVRGLQEAQRANLKAIHAVRPDGALDRATMYLATDAARYATAVTHRDTSTLSASHRVAKEASSRYRIHIDPRARNPRSGARASVYGPAEHNRGGSHAFYERTYQQGGQLATRAIAYLYSQLP